VLQVVVIVLQVVVIVVHHVARRATVARGMAADGKLDGTDSARPAVAWSVAGGKAWSVVCSTFPSAASIASRRAYHLMRSASGTKSRCGCSAAVARLAASSVDYLRGAARACVRRCGLVPHNLDQRRERFVLELLRCLGERSALAAAVFLA
jgi:hypothetical protein